MPTRFSSIWQPNATSCHNRIGDYNIVRSHTYRYVRHLMALQSCPSPPLYQHRPQNKHKAAGHSAVLQHCTTATTLHVSQPKCKHAAGKLTVTTPSEMMCAFPPRKTLLPLPLSTPGLHQHYTSPSEHTRMTAACRLSEKYRAFCDTILKGASGASR